MAAVGQTLGVSPLTGQFLGLLASKGRLPSSSTSRGPTPRLPPPCAAK
jgi:hypothetical protein